MDCFNDHLNVSVVLLSMQRKLSDFIKNIFICVLKKTKVFWVCKNTRVINDRMFLGEISV